MCSRTLILIAALIVVQASSPGQSRDSAATSRGSDQQRERVRAGQEGFRDENGNGVDDRIERQGIGKSTRKDRFVDADGDGICDGRAGGLGFRRGAMNGQQGAGVGAGAGAGKANGTGNRYGQGGKK